MNTEELHEFRKEIDALIQAAQRTSGDSSGGDVSHGFGSEYRRSLEKAYTHLQEAKMWVGKCLEASGSELPSEFTDKANTTG